MSDTSRTFLLSVLVKRKNFDGTGDQYGKNTVPLRIEFPRRFNALSILANALNQIWVMMSIANAGIHDNFCVSWDGPARNNSPCASSSTHGGFSRLQRFRASTG